MNKSNAIEIFQGYFSNPNVKPNELKVKHGVTQGDRLQWWGNYDTKLVTEISKIKAK